MAPSEVPPGVILRVARRRPGPAVVWSEVELRGPVFAVGRSPDADLVLDAPAASRGHARLLEVDGAWWIEDLGSCAGTRRDGRALPPGRHRVRSQDVFDVPGVVFALERSEVPPAPEMSASDLERCARIFVELETAFDRGRADARTDTAGHDSNGGRWLEVAAAVAAVGLLSLAVGALFVGAG